MRAALIYMHNTQGADRRIAEGIERPIDHGDEADSGDQDDTDPDDKDGE